MLHSITLLTLLNLWCLLLSGSMENNRGSLFIDPYETRAKDSVNNLLEAAKEQIDYYPEKAFMLALKAKDLGLQFKIKDKVPLAAKLMGEAKLELEDYYQAKKYLGEAVGMFTEETPRILGDSYYLLAKANYYLAEYEEANKNYRTAINLFEKSGDKRRIARAYQNIGLIHTELDHLDRAAEYYNKALAINTELKNDTDIAGLYQNLGIIFYRNNQLEKALDYYGKSINLYQQMADTQNIATTYSNIGLIQLQHEFYDEAFKSFETSYNLFKKVDFKMGKMWALHNMGTAKLWKKQFSKAEEYYNASMSIAGDLKNAEGRLSNLNALSEVRAQQGNYEGAFYFYIDYTELRDSLQINQASQKIAELEALYELEAREKKISQSLLELKKNKTQKTGLLISSIIIFLALIVLFIAYRKKKHSEVEMYSDKLNLENVLEEKNKELNTQIVERKIAEESDKLKSAFLANMSHELRTPMNAIIAFSNFLRDPDLPEAKRQEYLDHITGAGDNLLHLIDDIIDIAKLESKQLKISIGPVNISRMLRELKKVFEKIKLKNEYKADLILSTDPHNDYIVNTDVLRVKQIMINLIDNAFKYTARGAIEFGFKLVDEGILFFVRDTGIGIEPEKQIKIFDRFLQIDSELNRKYGGTGLGLTISKNLAELLGGRIWVESVPGKGSTFFVTIPPNELRTVEVLGNDIIQPSKPSRERNYNWSAKTILVAEDEELNFKVLDSCLSKTHARILRASDGMKAVELCRNEKVDIVLMDIQMPVMDGYEASQIIKTIEPSLPIIAQTSYAMANEKERCLDAGCDDFITKPLDLDRLFNLINKYLT